MVTRNRAQDVVKAIAAVPGQVVRYLSTGVVRLFSPTDDDYPKIGVQPFEGDITEK